MILQIIIIIISYASFSQEGSNITIPIMETLETNLQNPTAGNGIVVGSGTIGINSINRHVIVSREVDQQQRIKQSISSTNMAATNSASLSNISVISQTNSEVIQPSSPVVPSQTNSDGWQTHGATVRERNSLMYNNELMSDVTFLVGPKNCAQRIPAHKYVLATGSSVFYAMFFGDLAENSKEIVIPDVEAAAFLTLLRCVFINIMIQISKQFVLLKVRVKINHIL